MKKFVAFARVSSREQQREGFSLDVQEEALKKYAANLYWTPKDAARLCEQLVSKDLARKEKHHDCPLKRKDPLHVLLGLR